MSSPVVEDTYARNSSLENLSYSSASRYTVSANLMQVEPIMIYGRNYNCIFFCRPDAGSSHCSFAVWKTDEDDDMC